MSFTLEDSPVYKLSESFVNILATGIHFDPLPQSTDRCCLMMTTDKYKPKDELYLNVELKSKTHLSNILNYHKNQPYSCFLSNTMMIPPKIMKNQYNAICSFVIPRTMLDKDLTFFIMLRDGKVISNHSMPNVIAGEVNVAIDLLKASFFSKDHDIVPFKINWFTDKEIYSSICHSRGVVEFSSRQVEELKEEEMKGRDLDDINYSQIKENMIKKAVDNFTVNMANVPEKVK